MNKWKIRKNKLKIFRRKIKKLILADTHSSKKNEKNIYSFLKQQLKSHLIA